MNTYVHKTNQRVRVRSDFIRNNPDQVSVLIQKLRKIDAIGEIKHKRHAGSVAICFDDQELDCESVLEILQSHGWMRSDIKPSFVENAIVSGGKTFAKGLAGLALKRMLGPSVSRVILSL